MTLATVAEALGVSTMTVSNAYNRPEKLSSELRERILAKADELGYAGPDALARSLRRGRTGVLGIVLGEALAYAFEDPATVEFLRGLAGAGVPLHLVPASGGEGDAALVLNAAVDAFVVFAVPDGLPIMDAVVRRRLPVIIQGGPALPGFPVVAIDERAAAGAAADHLRELGHMRLAVVSLPFSLADRDAVAGKPPAHRATRGRLAGYGVTVGREVAVNDREHGELAAGVLLDGPEPPTALLCMSDELARGALRAARRRGLAVPDQLSVVGYDDTPEALRAEPPLTTIRQSLRDQGQRCAELAAAGADGPVEPQPWELIIRGSTAGFRAPVR